ncbi:unnamed protein product [Ilex paraguariensis]|uniref:Uncharacterized protein n=1 Tax=Ilex paraguariensis TaxID=185542 RepID=A0ABC8R095_9AQUA
MDLVKELEDIWLGDMQSIKVLVAFTIAIDRHDVGHQASLTCPPDLGDEGGNNANAEIDIHNDNDDHVDIEVEDYDLNEEQTQQLHVYEVGSGSNTVANDKLDMIELELAPNGEAEIGNENDDEVDDNVYGFNSKD